MLQRIISSLNNLSYRHPKVIVFSAVIFALIGGYLYFFHLEVLTDRNQMINEELASNRFTKAYQEEFGDEELLVLVVTAKFDSTKNTLTKNQRQQMKIVAQQWANQLSAKPDLFPKITERIDWAKWQSVGLLYLPYDQIVQIGDAVRTQFSTLAELAETPTLEQTFVALNASFKHLAEDSSIIEKTQIPFLLDGLTNFIHSINQKINRETTSANSTFENFDIFSLYNAGNFDQDGYFFVSDKTLIAYANVLGNPNERNRYAEVMSFAQSALENALNEVDASSQIEAGLAGMPALEFEEIKTAQNDFSRSAAIALVFITLLFTLSFGSIVRSVLAAFSLCLAIGLTFAFTWLVVGHLNVLAMIFTVILVALGIDFAIHFLTHYERSLASGNSPEKAIRLTHKSIGGALIMGGTTTAAAFLSAYFTEFVGLSELGLIAGGGLLICFFLHHNRLSGVALLS